MSERVSTCWSDQAGVVYLQVLLQINRSNIDCEQSLFLPEETNEQRRTPSSASVERREKRAVCFPILVLLAARVFATRLWTPLDASVGLRPFPQIFERRSQSRSDKRSY